MPPKSKAQSLINGPSPTDISPEKVTVWPAHPLFSVIIKMHSLERRLFMSESSAAQLRVALDEVCDKYRKLNARYRALLKKSRGKSKKHV